MITHRIPVPGAGPTDEECMEELVQRRPGALQTLFDRYAPLVFHIASQSLDPGSAEDIVQDVFVSVWRKADTFDPKRGALRSWLLQIAHFRILNELRSRSRRPRLDPDTDPRLLEDLPDQNAGPAEEAWEAYRREAVRAAVNRLPPSQRQALSLAFFGDLTHDQVASALNLPVGTVKTRIRTGLQKLRFILAPLGVAVVAIAVLVGVGTRLHLQRLLAERDDRALSMVTASDITTLHVPPASGAPAATHGSYRGRPGTPRAVLAMHNFAPVPRGETYQGWVLHHGVWTSMGTAVPDSTGDALLIAEGPAFTELPEAVQVTREPRGGRAQPSGPVLILWQAK
jgi:RNA polymerase sigma-70 factor (ECF subfamily)